jgi:hypothetical protein
VNETPQKQLAAILLAQELLSLFKRETVRSAILSIDRIQAFLITDKHMKKIQTVMKGFIPRGKKMSS